MKHRHSILTLTAMTIALVVTVISGVAPMPTLDEPSYDLSWHRVAAGGETFSTGSDYQLGATIAQPEAGIMSGGEEGSEYLVAGGFWAGGAHVEPSIPGDFNGDGVVDVSDLFFLLSQWGDCADPNDCPADLNGDGTVDDADLQVLLNNWS